MTDLISTSINPYWFSLKLIFPITNANVPLDQILIAGMSANMTTECTQSGEHKYISKLSKIVSEVV